MIGNKGQAFDTFKLMIAAVIAVAILGILLAILGGITFVTTPETMIEQQLQKAIQYKGSTFVSSTEADFQTGVIYTGESFRDIIGGVGPIDFECSGDLGSEICDASGETLEIKGNFRATVRACCESGTGADCHIGIGNVELNC